MMENYEKKYKEALERAKYLKENTDNVGAKDISYNFEYIFPELKESEDEKIRKEIIFFFEQEIPQCSIEEHKEYMRKWISWLEKQGEQNPTDKVEPKFKVGDIIKYVGEREEFSKEKHTIKEILDDCYLTIDDVYIPFKFEEYYIHINQNQPLSKEDEANMDAVWKACGQVYGTAYQSILGDWLKSLKSQNRWKPSEKQLTALKNAIIGKRGPLYDLYFDLEKL